MRDALVVTPGVGTGYGLKKSGGLRVYGGETFECKEWVCSRITATLARLVRDSGDTVAFQGMILVSAVSEPTTKPAPRVFGSCCISRDRADSCGVVLTWDCVGSIVNICVTALRGRSKM